MENIKSALTLNFNQDKDFFVIGTESGFKIFNTFPLKE